jgi:hypothetical protein
VHRASTGRASVGASVDRVSPCATILVLATGVSGCGDGVLQTTEVANSLREAGYPDPRSTPFDETLGRSGGVANLLQLPSGTPSSPASWRRDA